MAKWLIILMLVVWCGADYKLVAKPTSQNFIIVEDQKTDGEWRIIIERVSGECELDVVPLEPCVEQIIIQGIPKEKVVFEK